MHQSYPLFQGALVIPVNFLLHETKKVERKFMSRTCVRQSTQNEVSTKQTTRSTSQQGASSGSTGFADPNIRSNKQGNFVSSHRESSLSPATNKY